jgi:hypothetical protein
VGGTYDLLLAVAVEGPNDFARAVFVRRGNEEDLLLPLPDLAAMATSSLLAARRPIDDDGRTSTRTSIPPLLCLSLSPSFLLHDDGVDF